MLKFKQLKKLKINPIYSQKFVAHCCKPQNTWVSILKQAQKNRVSSFVRLHAIKKDVFNQRKQVKYTYGSSSPSPLKLDFLIWSSRFYPSLLAARHAVCSSKVVVNGIVQKNPNFILSAGDLVHIQGNITINGSFFTTVNQNVALQAIIPQNLEISFSTRSFVVCY
uniref:Ribosomal protein S4 n=1 Tax=Schizochytrium sp. TIO1101 TaxID=1868228 RepID=A0A2Z1THZ0_9STRA|nr:ribosomal protein S4 [Schizochytrium sp. TIO1101]